MTEPLNIWGWGHASKFPPVEERNTLAEQLGMMLGFTGLQAQEPPTLEALDMPASRLSLPDHLASFCTTEKAERARHSYGRSYPDILRGFRGQYPSPPDVVAYPTEESQIEALMEWCSQQGVRLIPFGGGTSVVGGVESRRSRPDQSIVSLDLTKMDRVLSVNETNQTAVIQAGAKGPVLEEQLATQGLTLRHFPQSFEFSTLGGWVATRAGGHFATLYTHIDDLVSSVRMLTPAGVWETRTLPASGAGPDPNRWVLGSEGALGIITEAEVRVRPRPRWRAKANVHFQDWNQAVDAVRAIAQSGLYPANCRLLDSREAMLHSVAFDNTHVLLLGFESAHFQVQPWLEKAVEIAKSFDGTLPEPPKHTDAEEKSAKARNSQDGAAAQAWRQSFLYAPYLFNTLVSLGVLVDTFETACTWSQFPALHNAVIQRVRGVLKEQCGSGFLSCRFTHVYPDGPAPYYTFLGPAKAGQEIEQWLAIKTAANEVLAEFGATATHHHAVGRYHRPWYAKEVPELQLASLRATKQIVDPAGILNPGVLLKDPDDDNPDSIL